MRTERFQRIRETYRRLPVPVRWVAPYLLSLLSLLLPLAVTALLVHHPRLRAFITFTFVVEIAAVAWLAGFWAGVLVTIATTPLVTFVMTGGATFIPQRWDPAAIAAMLLICLLASRIAAARKRTENVLRIANEELDRRVQERTQELERARESLQITLSSIGDAVIATSTDGRVTLLNGVAEALTGWTSTQALGRPLDEVFRIVNAETREPVENPVTRVLRNRAPVTLANHTVLLSRDGPEIPIDDSGAPILSSTGEVVGVVLTFRDISERYRAESERQRLLDADERLVNVLTNMNDGFVTVDRNWRLTFLNRKAADLMRTREDILGTSLWKVLPALQGTPAFKELEHAMRDGIPVRCEFQYEPFGLWLDMGAYPNNDELALLIRDVTQNQRLETQLRQAQKMEAVGRLAGGIAHDFNNLLTVINGYAELALMQLPDGQPLHESVHEILQAGRRAAELTNGLLAFSRKQIRQTVMVNLGEIVRGTERMLRRLVGEDIEIVTLLADELFEVEADRNQIEQIIVNLAVNARDAMPHGGTLTIETSNAELDDAYSRTHFGVPPGQYALLAVSDTGFGMDAVTQARIFEPFFTTKGPGKGTGLGLATVYGIVQQSGGSISVYSEPGHGTTFKMFFPHMRRGSDEAASTETPAVAAVPAGQRQSILLVEDEDTVRHLTARILQAHGYRVVAARNGPEALTRCRQEEGGFDLVLSDMVMPQMSGDQLAVEIRKLFPEMKFLFMSGYTEHAVVSKAMLTPGVSFLSKPFTSALLISKVHQALGAPEQAAGSAG